MPLLGRQIADDPPSPLTEVGVDRQEDRDDSGDTVLTVWPGGARRANRPHR